MEHSSWDGSMIKHCTAILGLICVFSISAAFQVHAPASPQSDSPLTDIPLQVRYLWDPESSELADWQMLKEPRTIIEGPQGELFVADTGNRRVIRFTPSDGLIEIIGGPGQGPGEFSQPIDLSYSPADSVLWVGDRRSGRISIFRLKDGWTKPLRGSFLIYWPC